MTAAGPGSRRGGDDRTGLAALRRAAMVEDQLAARGIADPAVPRVMGALPRERFLPPETEENAYDDTALPIGHGQTISQPWIVARMTEMLDLPGWAARHPDLPLTVLDVGTGSGYQAAVLAALGARVTTIERDPELAERATRTLASLGLTVRSIVGDGSLGYPPDAPYAGIVVAAAAPAIPPPLVEQLASGGRLVLPVGAPGFQELTLAWREDGELRTRTLGGCTFVPLVGRHGTHPGREG